MTAAAQPVTGLGPFRVPSYPTDSGTAYPLTIDADIAIIGREADLFTPCAQDTPTMKVVVGPGYLFLGTAVTLGGTGVVMQGNRDFRGNITSGSTVITGISRVDGLSPGMLIQGSSIPLNTTIVSVDATTQGAGQITISAAATATVSTNPLRASQLTSTITAPVANPRNDLVYIDGSTGIVGVATGSAAANPTDPALPAGKMPIARIRLSGSSVTAITNSIIDDIRAVQVALRGSPLYADKTGQVITGGASTTPLDLGTLAGGSTVVINCSSRSIQKVTLNGAGTLQINAALPGSCHVWITMGASASSLSFSATGGSLRVGSNTGTALSYTAGNVFLLMISVGDGVATYFNYGTQ